MSLSQLSKRDAIALEIMTSLLIQNQSKNNKDLIIEAFELADEFIWASPLSVDSDEATVLNPTSSIKPETTDESLLTQQNSAPKTDSLQKTAPDNQPTADTRPSFQVFTPDHPRNK